MTTRSETAVQLHCGSRILDLSEPRVMGILNVTPDSFSDGGKLFRRGGADLERVLHAASLFVTGGAALLDVGGESTRPGAATVSAEAECERVLPVVEALSERFDVVVSVDTSNAVLMREAASAGAGMINDVRALRREGALEAAAASGLAVCLMHMQGEPDTMQQDPVYGDVRAEVRDWLAERVRRCEQAGIARQRLCVDPGFGFGKLPEHNLQLLNGLEQLATLNLPVLAGLSRKSLIGHITGRPVGLRLTSSVLLAIKAAEHGARILRVHDVAETMDALKICRALEREQIDG